MSTGFFSWRWAPAIALVGGAIALAIAAVVFIPRSIGAPSVTRASTASVTLKRDAVPNGRDEQSSGAPVNVEPRRPRQRTSDTTPVSGVESFFSRAPEAELKAPLPDDPIVPEPANTAGNSDAFGPGAVPPSAPAP